MHRLDEDNFRFLSLTGVVMRIDHARDYLGPALDRVKAEVLKHDPDAPVCLHRADIVNFGGPFQVLRDLAVREEFDRRILQIMSDAEYKVITALIDKRWMTTQAHWQQTHPYHFLMEIIVEKYAQYLRRMRGQGDIMPEARGNKQDSALQAEFGAVRERGTRFANAQLTQATIPHKNLKFRTKKENIAGLQLCDLIAHPSHFTIRQNQHHEVRLGTFAERVSEILVRQKYDRSYYGEVRGYGYKYLP